MKAVGTIKLLALFLLNRRVGNHHPDGLLFPFRKWSNLSSNLAASMEGLMPLSKLYFTLNASFFVTESNSFLRQYSANSLICALYSPLSMDDVTCTELGQTIFSLLAYLFKYIIIFLVSQELIVSLHPQK